MFCKLGLPFKAERVCQFPHLSRPLFGPVDVWCPKSVVEITLVRVIPFVPLMATPITFPIGVKALQDLQFIGVLQDLQFASRSTLRAFRRLDDLDGSFLCAERRCWHPPFPWINIGEAGLEGAPPHGDPMA